jgi:hypothetical protein
VPIFCGFEYLYFWIIKKIYYLGFTGWAPRRGAKPGKSLFWRNFLLLENEKYDFFYKNFYKKILEEGIFIKNIGRRNFYKKYWKKEFL